MSKFLRSPIFYMGNKLRLLDQLIPLFPAECTTFVDLFGGGGCISGNYQGEQLTIYNEINPNIYNLYKMLLDNNPQTIINRIEKNIEVFDLNKEGENVRQNDATAKPLRDYYSNNYFKFRDFYNKSERDIIDLFTLTFYSFSNLIRFNQKSDFNMPYNNRCFTSEHREIINNWHEALKDKNIQAYNLDYKKVLDEVELNENDFVYNDPPYYSSMAIYNEKQGTWEIKDDLELFDRLEKLNAKGVKWGLSNVFSIKGKTNQHLIDWCEKNKWNVYHLNLKYSALGKGNSNNDEVYICNYHLEKK